MAITGACWVLVYCRCSRVGGCFVYPDDICVGYSGVILGLVWRLQLSAFGAYGSLQSLSCVARKDWRLEASISRQEYNGEGTHMLDRRQDIRFQVLGLLIRENRYWVVIYSLFKIGLASPACDVE